MPMPSPPGCLGPQPHPTPPHALPSPHPPPPRSPTGLQGGFSWFGFSLFLLQPRIRTHRYAAAAVAAAQLPALHGYCSDHFAATPTRCMAIGAVKVSLLALLPLAGVYWLESRARCLFLEARHMGGAGTPAWWLPPLGGGWWAPLPSL